jgi:hypothetical protein
MVAASKAILDRVDRILAAAEEVDPEASLDPVLSSLLSVAYAGQQAGVIFGDAVPTADVVDSFENTILVALDLSVGDVDTAAVGCRGVGRDVIDRGRYWRGDTGPVAVRYGPRINWRPILAG